MPYYLLTSTTYGTWLPGDRRGSVTAVRDRRPDDPETTSRVVHNRPGERWEPPRDRLWRSRLRSNPVWLSVAEADVVLASFCKRADYRGHRMLAGSVMANHFHLVVGVFDEADPRRLLTDFKAHATRVLRSDAQARTFTSWWTRGGSRRRLRDRRAVRSAVHYVLERQPRVLARWASDGWWLDAGD